MCQIIVKPVGKKFDMKKLDKAQGWNEDGYGVTWWEDKQLHTFTTMDYKKFKSILSTLKDHNAVAHLRNTTRGVTKVENNHPFDIPSGKLFHNGTISGLSCDVKGGSDTQALAELLNGCDYNYIEDVLPLVHQIVGTTMNKLVFFEDDGNITMVNGDLGQIEDEIWYSNDYHERDTTRADQYKSYSKKQAEWVYHKESGTYMTREDIAKLDKDDYKVKDKKEKLTRVFVYGTLKAGFNNHKTFLGNSKLIGKATTVSKWAMIGKDMSFPYLLRRDNDNGMNIVGEVYEVTPAVLANLDYLEGTPTHYTHSQTYVSYMNGNPSENVQVYVKSTVTAADLAKPFISEFTKAKLVKTN